MTVAIYQNAMSGELTASIAVALLLAVFSFTLLATVRVPERSPIYGKSCMGLVLKNIQKVVPRTQGACGVEPERSQGRISRFAGSQRMRKDDLAFHYRRVDQAGSWSGCHRWKKCGAPAAKQPWHRLYLPRLRPFPAYDGFRKHCLRSWREADEKIQDKRPGFPLPETGEPGGSEGSFSASVERRAEAADRSGQGAGSGTRDTAHG